MNEEPQEETEVIAAWFDKVRALALEQCVNNRCPCSLAAKHTDNLVDIFQEYLDKGKTLKEAFILVNSLLLDKKLFKKVHDQSRKLVEQVRQEYASTDTRETTEKTTKPLDDVITEPEELITPKEEPEPVYSALGLPLKNPESIRMAQETIAADKAEKAAIATARAKKDNDNEISL